MLEQGMKILVERKLLPGLTKVFYISMSILLSATPVQSLGGAKYFVSFIDDYSRKCCVYPIKKKSNVFEVFKVYKARVELDSRKKIKCLRTDNGDEYTGDEFDTFCKQEGIKRQFTTAYTPQQNRVAKRMNITLLERARACYVINHSPSTAVELKTPMEM
ncbi:gag-pol polyprotein [Tanacetum coccineum]